MYLLHVPDSLEKKFLIEYMYSRKAFSQQKRSVNEKSIHIKFILCSIINSLLHSFLCFFMFNNSQYERSQKQQKSSIIKLAGGNVRVTSDKTIFTPVV